MKTATEVSNQSCKSITLLSVLSLSVASVHKQRGDESGSVGGQEVMFMVQHYITPTLVGVLFFFPSLKKCLEEEEHFYNHPIWTSYGLLLSSHTHVQKLICVRRKHFIFYEPVPVTLCRGQRCLFEFPQMIPKSVPSPGPLKIILLI